MSKAIKRLVRAFVKRHALTAINYETLRTAAEAEGYTLIEFNAVFNDKDVATVIQNLNLDEAILRSRGFTYADKNHRLIFVNEDLTAEEKTLVLSHELGHIAGQHLSSHPIIGNDVKEEHKANEFSHYILNQGSLQKFYNLVTRRKWIAVTIGALLLLMFAVTALGLSAKKEQTYYGDYYITTSGSKYHKSDCIHVKDKSTARRLTKDEFETGTYTGCEMCLPDK